MLGSFMWDSKKTPDITKLGINIVLLRWRYFCTILPQWIPADSSNNTLVVVERNMNWFAANHYCRSEYGGYLAATNDFTLLPEESKPPFSETITSKMFWTSLVEWTWEGIASHYLFILKRSF